jgi:hypothetical protein
MNQSEPNAHVDDGDSAFCFGQKGWPVLLRERYHWNQEHFRFRSVQPLALPVHMGGQIDYSEYSACVITSMILFVMFVFLFSEQVSRF